MTWLTTILIVWAAATLGLLVGALMCAAGGWGDNAHRD